MIQHPQGSHKISCKQSWTIRTLLLWIEFFPPTLLGAECKGVGTNAVVHVYYWYVRRKFRRGPELFFLIFFSVHFPCNLKHFGAGNCLFNGICTIFEFEPPFFPGICNILVLFATFWSWKLPFQTVYLHHSWVRTSLFPWNLQHFSTICNILELETAISTVYLQHFWKFATLRCSNCSCNMLVGNWVHVGLVLGFAFFYLYFFG